MPLEIEPSAFCDDGRTDFEKVIVTAPQIEKVAHALTAAAPRFLMVNEEGTEYTEEQWQILIDDGIEDEFYTPNFVSEIEVEPGGASVYLDCKGEISAPMRDRLLAILRTELANAGVADARIWSPPGRG
jgi:hypothetical protein